MTNSTLTTLTAAQIISANLGPRYKGRTALVRAAEQGNAQALELLSATPSQRRIAAVTGKISSKLAAALGLTDELERVHYLRRARHAAQLIHDPILNRRINNVPRRATLRAFRAALETADFRTATHSHNCLIDYVDPGHESASSSTGSMRSEDAGLSKAYCRQAWSVTTSTHRFMVSTAFFAIPSSERAGSGWIRLSPTYTVRQSRGTALRTEIKR
jgi:hypothetical protein